MTTRITHALISVSDKTDIVPLGRRLAALGITLLSTGGTARALREAGVAVTEVADFTGFPEILDGRVKTLHPRIHGGILARGERDAATLREHAMAPIGIVVVNLYPFAQTIAAPDCTFEQAVEQIDIGGPAMLRAAAKNHRHVLVMVDPADYPRIVEQLERDGDVDEATRTALAARAFAHTAAYDTRISHYLEEAGESRDTPDAGDGTSAPALPAHLSLSLTRRSLLRYGENPHQAAALYDCPALAHADGGFRQHAGKALSFNNLVDAQTAVDCARELSGNACVIVKHANPCGAARADDALAAYRKAYAADPTSAFGGIVAFNQPIGPDVVEAILVTQFVEVIACPSLTADCDTVLQGKPNVRLLTFGDGEAAGGGDAGTARLDLRPVADGVLVQEADTLRVGRDQLRVVTRRAPDEAALTELLFAWTIVKWVKSNAIVYTRDGQTLGIGGGQTSRIDAARFGAAKAAAAGAALAGAAMASDAFFPFRDSIDAAAQEGVALIIQPGGSKRDDEVIAAADEHDIAMVFTGVRHFRH